MRHSPRLDSLAVIDAHEQSNALYIGGKSLGIVQITLSFSAFALCCSLVINFLFSHLSFNGWYYLFYLFTYVFPTTVFLVGFSFFVTHIIHNRSLSFFVVICYLLLTFLFLSSAFYGLFDPFGRHLPNTFSDMVGFSDPWGYLFHRFCWFFLGIGFLSCSIAICHRLPNRPRERAFWLRIGTGCLLLGIGTGFIFYQRHHRGDRKSVV